MNLDIKVLRLNPGFTVYDTNVDGQAPWPMRERRHHFDRPDGPDAHDHPFPIEVYIPLIGGGYIEEIFRWSDATQRWSSSFVERLPGTAFVIPAQRVHRIDRLLAPVVWTYVVTGPWEQDCRVYPEAEIRNRMQP